MRDRAVCRKNPITDWPAGRANSLEVITVAVGFKNVRTPFPARTLAPARAGGKG
jgi:hypothetical protein